MTNKTRKFFGVYQFFYGSLGIIYDTYFLFDAINDGLQRVLMVVFLLLFSLFVFVAGYRAWHDKSSWVSITLIAQLLQLYPLHTENVYVSLRCGISYDFLYKLKDFDINLLDLNSAFAWKEAPAFQAGFNVIPLFLCLFLIIRQEYNRQK